MRHDIFLINRIHVVNMDLIVDLSIQVTKVAPGISNDHGIANGSPKRRCVERLIEIPGASKGCGTYLAADLKVLKALFEGR
jgi:hypothetical protein